MVAQTRKSGKPSPKKFKFSDKLVGKGLTTDALLKKLKKLHADLAELEQDDADRKALEPVCKELTSSSILFHKDKGVKAYAACCIADLLRLFAPDAPLTAAELRDIFQFFFHQVSQGLKGSDSPYYHQYVHLLESLSTVKSVVLVCDLPQAEELLTTIFRSLFNLVRNDLPKNIEMFMTEILVALIDECQLVPQEVLEIIMAQFMDKDARLDQPAYRLAADVCKETADKLQRNVCQYFTDNIVQHAQAEDYEEVERCHTLIKQLNHACPALLHNVVPQLEEELRVEEIQIRQMATQALGEMFADSVGGDLEKKFPSTWSLWLAKKNDKAATVRLAFVEACKGLILHHRLDLRESVEDALYMKLQDPDDKVRAAVCKLYSQLDYETSLRYVSEKQLRAVADRFIDKKANVRHESLTSIGRLYSVAYPEIENNVPDAIKHFAWIPQEVLVAINTIKEAKTLGMKIIWDYILPLPNKSDEEAAWTDRLLTVMRYLDGKAISTLIGISNLKLPHPSPYERFIDVCAEHNGGVIDENEQLVKNKLNHVIRAVSAFFSDPLKTADDLRVFADMNEQRLYKLLRSCFDVHVDLKTVIKSSNDFSKRLHDASSLIHPTMMSLLRQGCLWIVNASSVSSLIKRLQKGDHSGRSTSSSAVQVAANHAQTLLTTIAKQAPAVYRPHVGELMKAIADEKNPRLAGVCLQALAAVGRIEPGVAPTDKRTLDRLMNYARGSEERHAKYATRALTCTKDREELCSDLVDHIVDNLSTADPETLAAHVASLVEVVRWLPDAFEEKSEDIISFLLKVLLQPSSEDTSMEVDDQTEWLEEERLPPLAKVKILTLKLCRHRCLVHANSESALDIASPVLQLFFSILQNGGMLTEDAVEDSRVKSRLRLQAALSLAHLSTIDKYTSKINPNFVLLAVTIQDSCFNVRLGFLDKLTLLIHSRKLPPRFNIILFLTAHDPEDEIKDKAKGFVAYQYRKETLEGKLKFWELIFVRLLHALAHHPDFGLDDYQVLDLSKYIILYVSQIAHLNNISLLYHLAQKCKTVRDAESHTFSENLYAVSELAQELIKSHARNNQWSLESYPGKVKMPSDIFRPLPGAEAGKSIFKNVYLPEHALNAVLESISSTAREKQKQERKQAPKRKASGADKTNGASKRPRPRPRRKKRMESDDEDGSDVNGSEAEKSALSSVPDSDVSGDESENDDGDGNEDLGRGARGRAKVKAKRKAKTKAKNKAQYSDS